VIARLSDRFYVVTNAGCREKDTAYFKEQLEAWRSEHPDKPVEWEILDGQGLIALQGPMSAEILSRVLDDKSKGDLTSLYFGQCTFATIKGTDVEVLVSRAGYTGEDGFEISIPSSATEAVTQFLFDSAKDELRFAGLGARDTLRLEAGMCLYGHDLDDTTTPVEGALSWIIGKDRRVKGGFHGDSVILQQCRVAASACLWKARQLAKARKSSTKQARRLATSLPDALRQPSRRTLRWDTSKMACTRLARKSKLWCVARSARLL
jgi:aminomethyltransferase